MLYPHCPSGMFALVSPGRFWLVSALRLRYGPTYTQIPSCPSVCALTALFLWRSRASATGEQAPFGAFVSEGGREDPTQEPGSAGSGRFSAVSCFHPLQAFRTPGGDVCIGAVVPGDCWKLELPCGRCIGCKQDRARAWMLRIQHEAQLYDSNVFVTLTYSDSTLPASRSLEYPHFQGFMKRLRYHLEGVSALPDGSKPIRFFVAGEYGDANLRPHWHAILFNCRFPDTRQMLHGKLVSAQLEELWGLGFADLGAFTPARAAYVAGYTRKKVHGSRAADHYEDVVNVRTGELSSRRPEFAQMSRAPGIGALWFQRFAGDLFPRDRAVADGKEWKVPRFYLERWKRTADPALVEEILHARYLKAQESREENTPERRAVREELALRRAARRPREL